MSLDFFSDAKKHIGFEYVPLNFNQVDARIEKRASNEQIGFEFMKTHWIAYSVTCPEVYYKLDVLFDDSGFCTCPSFVHKQAKQGKPCKHLVALNRNIERGT